MENINTAEGLKHWARNLDRDSHGILDQGMAMVELCKRHSEGLEDESEAVIVEGLSAMIHRLVDFACDQQDLIGRVLPYVEPEKEADVQIQEKLNEIFGE